MKGWFSIFIATALSAAIARAEAPKCDWNGEIYKDKVSEDCQKEFEGKLTNEQDKIFARRMFKEWTSAKGFEVEADDGYLQISSETGDYEFQSQWISQDPPMMWINGNVVADDTKNDPSIYRRIERMMKKSEMMEVSARNPIRYLFQIDEAFAAKAQGGTAQNLEFLYTVNNFTGSAGEILSGKDTTGQIVYEDTSGFGRFFGSKEQYTCNGNMVGERELTIDGRKIHVKPISRTDFKITGLLNGKEVRVHLAGHSAREGEKPRVHTWTDKHGKTHKRLIYSTPCNGYQNGKMADHCRDAWSSFIESHPEAKKKFDEMVKAKGDKVNWNRDITCGALYRVDGAKDADIAAKAKDCRHFFWTRFPVSASRFSENSAQFEVCEDSTKGVNCKKTSPEDLAKLRDERLAKTDRTPNHDTEVALRDAYRKELDAAGFNADKLCPKPSAGRPSGECMMGEAAYVNPACTIVYDKMPDCQKWPGKVDAKKEAPLSAAYKAMQTPLVQEVKTEGSHVKGLLEKRLLGLMMLGDCCGNSQCASKISSKSIELKNSKSVQ